MGLPHSAFGVLVALLWGGNFVAAKFGVAYFPPFLLTAMRFMLVSALLIPLVRRPTAVQMKMLLPIALMSALHFSLLFVTLSQGLDISSAAIIGQLGVPFACLLGAIFLGDRMGPWRIMGMGVAFAGIAIVAGTPNVAAHPAAFAIGMGAALSWAVANIQVKRVCTMGHMQLLAWISLFTVPVLLALSLLFERAMWAPFSDAPISAWLGLLYTAIGSTVIAYGLWYFLLSHHNVSQVSPFSLLTPVFGIAFGQLFFYESLTVDTLTGGALTVGGVAIIVVRRPKLAAMGRPT